MMIEGSSVDEKIVARVKRVADGKKRIIVFLDSNHSHDHVLRELELYSPLISKGSYLVVFDTVSEYMPKESAVNRPWGKGSNPLTAVRAFLKHNKNFVVDREIENKLTITTAPNGFLKRIR